LSRGTVTVLIPTYNRAEFIAECIESILAQTRHCDEVIVINDGCSDNTEEVVRSFQSDKIAVLSKPNGGKASALNLGMKEAKGDYIWIADDDDIAFPNALASLASLLDEDPTTDIALGRFVSFYEDDPKRKQYDLTYAPRPSERNPKILFLEQMFTNQFAMLVRRSLYAKVGAFREDLVRSGDIEMVLRLTRYSKATYVPIPIFKYRLHGGVRGSRRHSFPAAESEKTWQAYCEIFYKEIRNSYHLDEFTPSFASAWDLPKKQRAQFLQRGLIFAQQSMWPEAINDLESATNVESSPATPQEIELTESVIVYNMPWETLYASPEMRRRVRQMNRSSKYGHTIVFAASYRLLRFIARQLFKKRELDSSLRMGRLLLDLLGPVDTLRRIMAKPTRINGGMSGEF
jgi:glycosyltransferase involved in cell wall biosynthesis